MKSNLIELTSYLLALIEKGEDFVVKEFDCSGLIPMLFIKEDVEPHVCDFLKAGLEKEWIAYYFAYLICTPGFEVYASKSLTHIDIDGDIRPTLQDCKTIDKIIDNYWDKAIKCKNARMKKNVNEERL